ncbi:MAG: HNH endonuclease [Nitrospirae bacterium]|nr:HNH endonuclease [Nitrospirota bacterium]MBF0592991.1 HNH endonuclease [Nitrospirota bacterium]
MVNIERSYPEPDKSDVLKRLHTDFKNKCYICEYTPINSGMEVEHFVPQSCGKELKFQWDNLFFACRHCNITTSTRYNTNDDNKILNCTNSQHDVVNWIKYEYDINYEFTVRLTTNIELITNTLDSRYKKIIDNTVKLLTEVYNGKSPAKTMKTSNLTMEASNLRILLKDKILYFKELLKKYKQTDSVNKKEILREKIETELRKDSAFTAFKRWIIMKSRHYSAFADYFD